MSKGSFAKEEVMEEYLSALLTDVQTELATEDKLQKESVAKLLEKAQPAQEQVVEQTVEEVPEIVETPSQAVEDAKEIQLSVEKNKQSTETESHVRDEAFQALFFDVAGLTMAVPLTELGGIHQIDKIGPLFGKPDWFMGVMLHREEKLSAVDTAKWVMPEKYDEKLAESLNYQYLIMLDDSSWGLACERLITTATLEPDRGEMARSFTRKTDPG